MIDERLERLAARRDRLFAAGKLLVIGGTMLWLIGMALYDSSLDSRATSILLPAQSRFWPARVGVEPLDIQRVWGGPATLFGMQALLSGVIAIGLLHFVRTRLWKGRNAWGGIVLAFGGFLLLCTTFSDEIWPSNPVLLDRPSFDRMLAGIEQRHPGVTARLRDGERLELPRQVKPIPFGISTIGPKPLMTDDGLPLVRDREDAEALRFGLAQRALITGDLATLRRLLPIDLHLVAADLSARHDIGQRLEAIGKAAQRLAVPRDYPHPVSDWARTWHRALFAMRVLRHTMQLCMLTGLLAMLAGLIVRRRHAAILRHLDRLAERKPRPAPQATG